MQADCCCGNGRVAGGGDRGGQAYFELVAVQRPGLLILLASADIACRLRSSPD
jgi:hypothetical protein